MVVIGRLYDGQCIAVHSRRLPSDPAAGVERPVLVAGLPDEALEEINRLWTIARAFSSTAHDVNNAMQVIAGSAELLEARELDPVVRRRVEAIRTEAARVAATLNRLLEYVRERHAALQRLDLWSVVELAVAMRASSAGRRRVVIAIDRPDPSPIVMTIDQSKTLQVLLNLLLTAEERIAGSRNAKVVVTIPLAEPVTLTVTASGEDTGAVETNDEPVRVLTAGLQAWTAAHLAASQGARLAVQDTAGTITFTLTFSPQ